MHADDGDVFRFGRIEERASARQFALGGDVSWADPSGAIPINPIATAAARNADFVLIVLLPAEKGAALGRPRYASVAGDEIAAGRRRAAPIPTRLGIDDDQVGRAARRR